MCKNGDSDRRIPPLVMTFAEGEELQPIAHPTHDIEPVRRHDPLLSAFAIKKLVLKNRIISTSHASGLTEDDFPKERYQRYHEEKAIGGIAMSMFGGSSNVGIDSPSVFRQIDMGVDEVVPHLQQFSARMHAHGAALMCQLTHMADAGARMKVRGYRPLRPLQDAKHCTGVFRAR
jgi:2,4-dienoyl-CoA reductase-like NADH-dependent reductase (Old Yellow Enzyme family)